jgi:glycosyltransferase involved in cell wall biosynthesis
MSLASVVIPTYNRPRQLAACLRALAAQRFPRERFEVVVVDDGSPSPLDDLLAEHRPQLQVRLLRQERQGPAAARNAGANAARGAILAFTDDDCRPHPDWLRVLTLRLSATPTAMVGGQTINALRDNPCAEASQILVSFIYDYYNRPGRRFFFTSNNIAVARAGFLAVGGFDTRYPRAAAEDRDFCDRWQQAGFRMVYAPEAQIEHAHAMTLRGFWRQHLNYGRGAYHFHRGRAQRDEARVRVEPLRFYLQLLEAPLRVRPLPQALALSALLAVSQGANTLGFFEERVRSGAGKP